MSKLLTNMASHAPTIDAFQIHHVVFHVGDAVLAVHQQIVHAQVGALQFFFDLFKDLQADVHRVALYLARGTVFV